MATINLKLPFSEELVDEYMEFIDLDSMNELEITTLPRPFLYNYYFEYSTRQKPIHIDVVFELLAYYLKTKHESKVSTLVAYFIASIKNGQERAKTHKFFNLLEFYERYDLLGKILGYFKNSAELLHCIEKTSLHVIFFCKLNDFKTVISQISKGEVASKLTHMLWSDNAMTTISDYKEKVEFISKFVDGETLFARDFIRELFSFHKKDLSLMVNIGISAQEVVERLVNTSRAEDFLEDKVNYPSDDEIREAENNLVSLLDECFTLGADPNPLIYQALKKSDKRILVSFLKHGANPNFFFDDGDRIVHELAKENEYEKLEIVINFGANVNYLSKKRNTALCEAIKERSEDSVKILLKHGADPNKKSRLSIKDALGNVDDKKYRRSSSRNYAVRQRNDYIKLLNKKGVDLDLIEEIEEMVEEVFNLNNLTSGTSDSSDRIYRLIQNYTSEDKWLQGYDGGWREL